MLKKLPVKDSFKSFKEAGNYSNRTVAGRVRTVTLLRHRLHVGILQHEGKVEVDR